MVKERQDITGSNCLKGVSGKVIVGEKGMKDSLKEYMEKLMNEENELDHRILARVKEGPADCIRFDEVAPAYKRMKRHKTPCLSNVQSDSGRADPRTVTSWPGASRQRWYTDKPSH